MFLGRFALELRELKNERERDMLQKWPLKRITPGRLTFVCEAGGLNRNIFSAADTFFYNTMAETDTDIVCNIRVCNEADSCGNSFGDKQ